MSELGRFHTLVYFVSDPRWDDAVLAIVAITTPASSASIDYESREDMYYTCSLLGVQRDGDVWIAHEDLRLRIIDGTSLSASIARVTTTRVVGGLGGKSTASA